MSAIPQESRRLLRIEGAGTPADPRSLLERLAQALEHHRVRYCQWKGHWSAHRWSAGLGDVDLLVDPECSTAFRQVAGDLGFKPALLPGARQIAGVESYFGHDPSVPRLLHLHVHYRLVVGDFWRSTYRVPLERVMLERSRPGTLFRVPDPTLHYVIFVLRMMLVQRGRPLLALGRRWRKGIRAQLDSLEGLTERRALAGVLSRHLRPVDLAFFDRCAASLRGDCGAIERALLPERLHLRLRPYAHRPGAGALLSASADRLLPSWLRRMIADERMRPATGGAAIALVGGDGSGKSTSATELTAWLGTVFATRRAHLGHPPRSALTLAAGGLLKLVRRLERGLGLPHRPGSLVELLRHVCTARDCYLLYRRLLRFTAAGGVAICERYPVPQLLSHVGPNLPGLLSQRAGPLARALEKLEAEYYGRILAPDMLLVLRLDPELAVLRKPGEPAEYVRTRGQAVWDADWTCTPAQVVDAGRPFPQVLEVMKSLVWSAL